MDLPLQGHLRLGELGLRLPGNEQSTVNALQQREAFGLNLQGRLRMAA